MVEEKGFNWINVSLWIVFCLAILGSAYYFIFVYDSNVVSDGGGLISVSDLGAQESLNTRLRATYQPIRDYGFGTYQGKSFPIIDMFGKLPPVPDDFYKIKALIMQGNAQASDLCGLSSDYYLQPEFFGNNWVEVGLPRYKNPDPTHWTPEGYGTFPHEISVLVSPGESFEACSFFHSSWTVETYQGFGLGVVYPSSVNDNGISVSVNVSESRKYLSATISPREVLVEPSYVFFEPGWAKMIRLNVTVSPDTPPGLYSIGFDVHSASLQQGNAWREEFGNLYQSKSGVSVGAEQFVLGVRVR